MASPKQHLSEAIERWQREAARERIARWRADPDALSEEAVADRHEALRGARLRDRFLEEAERGAITGDERAAIASWLREAHVVPARAAATARLHEALVRPVPYDSDHHRAVDLLTRVTETPDARRRRAIAKALEPTWADVTRARREGRARMEEALEAARWLENEAAHPDASEVEDPLAILDATEEPWRELTERLTHAAGTRPAHWSDLLHALRATRWDDLAPRASRWRRLAAQLGGLGLGDALTKRARVEPRCDGLRAQVVVVAPREDVRIGSGPELGIASERDATIALGYAAATALVHPGLPDVLARPLHGSVPSALGHLLAHLAADPVFARQSLATLTERERRPVIELVLGHEIFELRTYAAAALCQPHLDTRDLGDVAHAQIQRAWGVELSRALAEMIAHEPGAGARLRSARWAPSIHVALRERWDEDFWRNPAAAEPIRGACSRGASLSIEAWMEELDVDAGALGGRMTELLS